MARKASAGAGENRQKSGETKTIHFIAGMPRAGSTLLINILLQNPNFGGIATSGLVEVMLNTRNQWNNWIWHKAMPEELRNRLRDDTLRGLPQSYYGHREEPVVFDKNRGWPAHCEVLKKHVSDDFKILVCVRDLRDVLASFEKMFRRVAADQQPVPEAMNYLRARTALGRAQLMLSDDQIVGSAVNMIKDAHVRGFGEHLHFVEFDRLCKNPEKELQDIYEFIGVEYFKHNFNQVEQQTEENDFFHQWTTDLHEIRPKVAPLKGSYSTVYDESITSTPWWRGDVPGMTSPLKDKTFWRDLES